MRTTINDVQFMKERRRGGRGGGGRGEEEQEEKKRKFRDIITCLVMTGAIVYCKAIETS